MDVVAIMLMKKVEKRVGLRTEKDQDMQETTKVA